MAQSLTSQKQKRKQSNWNEKQTRKKDLKKHLAEALSTLIPTVATRPTSRSISSSIDFPAHGFEVSSDSEDSIQEGLPPPECRQAVPRSSGIDLLCLAAQLVELNLIPLANGATPARLPVSSDPRDAIPMRAVRRRPLKATRSEDLKAMHAQGDNVSVNNLKLPP